MTIAQKFTDWPELIGESVLLRQRLHQSDPAVNPYTIPHLSATTEQIESTETRLGSRLDILHRQLLAHANGWDYFFNYSHLLTTDELGSGPRWEQVSELLDIFYSDGMVPEGMPPRAEVQCVCANPEETEDLFVVWQTGPLTDGGRPVSWLAGEEVQRFANMHEFLLSINEYLRRDITETAP